MKRLIAALTRPGAEYPGYVNVSEEAGEIVVTVRGDPTVFDGEHICGFAADKGDPGRCTPGDDRCNNYCNMAPEKGAMAAAPLPCRGVRCGETVSVRLTAAEWSELLGELKPGS